MNKSRNVLTLLPAVLLALTLIPFSALAVTENTLESAPMGTVSEDSSRDRWGSDYDEDEYKPAPLYSTSTEFNYYLPHMAAEEAARYRELAASVQAGETVPSADLPEAPREYKVGVYPLNPADFDGETFYVTLPGRQLTDEDLLYLISCFRELDITFDPDSLSSRNCLRGISYFGNGTRDLASEELERMDAIRYMVIRGMLTPEEIHPESECKTIETHSGLFCFYPYRSMTDDELAAFALAKESVWENNPNQVEKAARDSASGIVSLPVSMSPIVMERSVKPYSRETDGYTVLFDINEYDANGRPFLPAGPSRVQVDLKRMPDGSLETGSLTVTYSYHTPVVNDSNPYSRSKSPDALMDVARQWLAENVKLSGLDGFSWNTDAFSSSCITAANGEWQVVLYVSGAGAVTGISLTPAE